MIVTMLRYFNVYEDEVVGSVCCVSTSEGDVLSKQSQNMIRSTSSSSWNTSAVCANQ